MDRYVGDSARAEMDVITFGAMMWRHRLVIAIACALCIAAAIGYLMIAHSYYRGEVTIVPAHDESMSGNGSGLSEKMGALGSLAGLNLGGENPEDQAAEAVLDSRQLAEEFVRRNDLVPVLLTNLKHPTLWRAVNLFKLKVAKVKKDLVKGTTKVTVEWLDPKTAAEWANGLVALANETMRTRARAEASRNIEYLNHQLESTTDVEVRRDIYDIIESQMRALMLANGRVEYAFRVIDPAVPPEVRSRPQPILVLLVALGLGLGVGSAIAFVRDRLAARRRAETEGLTWREQQPAGSESATPLPRSG